MSGLLRPSPLACASVTFLVNVALMADQWQHHVELPALSVILVLVNA